ncbi:MAG: DEAD/DEAH box helicase family protein [Clostridia bacterium]|nr:DEAD/DEAH box helicase family protein [Clostridia bacterium]
MYTKERASYINESISNIIREYYLTEDDKKHRHDLIKKVCEFYDNIKDDYITKNQLLFLYHISNLVGIPQYYDMLIKYRNDENFNIDSLNASTLSDMIYNSSLAVAENKFLHKYQKEVIEKFLIGNDNRFFLTAPTSFGKTFIVYEVIKKMSYKNIVFIYPTLSLLSENYIKILKDPFFNEYNVFTLSETNIDLNQKNVCIYTPERFLSMMDRNNGLKFDFVFMDEVYKIDNQFIIDSETVGENERDTSFRVALQTACGSSKDLLLAGPFIQIPKSENETSINNFLNDNNFKVLEYNDIEIVDKELLTISKNDSYKIDKIDVLINKKDKGSRLLIVLDELNRNNNSSIVYTYSRYNTEQVAKNIAKHRDDLNFPSSDKITMEMRRFLIFLKHINNVFGEDWILSECLRKGVGIHHGYIPKYIQKEVIRFFNDGILNVIVSTTTITEGVNTSAKNMIVLSDKKGTKPLKKFDAQNIAGRAGRFICHYKGRVVAIDNNFEQIIESDGEIIRNIEYDKNILKNEIDILSAPEKYLSDSEKKTKKELMNEAHSLGMTDDIINQFKTIKLSDKILLYKKIKTITDDEVYKVQNVCVSYRGLMWDNFDFILEYIKPIIKNRNLLNMIEYRTGLKKNSVLTVKVHNYIIYGYPGILNYEKRQNNTDTAVRKVAELTFNLFKYELVKYLGVFDLLFRFEMSQRLQQPIDEVFGINTLLKYLEYNSITEEGKKISDYGVPFNVLHYVDTKDESVKGGFDSFEALIYNDIKDDFNI